MPHWVIWLHQSHQPDGNSDLPPVRPSSLPRLNLSCQMPNIAGGEHCGPNPSFNKSLLTLFSLPNVSLQSSGAAHPSPHALASGPGSNVIYKVILYLGFDRRRYVSQNVLLSLAIMPAYRPPSTSGTWYTLLTELHRCSFDRREKVKGIQAACRTCSAETHPKSTLLKRKALLARPRAACPQISRWNGVGM